VPVAGFLEPAQVERLGETGEADRLLGGPAAIGVDHQDEVRPRGLACGGHALEVGLGSQPADLELAAGHPGRAIGFHLSSDVGERLALHVVAADRDDGQPLAVAAQQRAHGLAQGLAHRVPHRAVDAGDGLHQEWAAHPRGVGEGEAVLPDALALHDRESDDLPLAATTARTMRQGPVTENPPCCNGLPG
jgi:hypothetical protein